MPDTWREDCLGEIELDVVNTVVHDRGRNREYRAIVDSKRFHGKQDFGDPGPLLDTLQKGDKAVDSVWRGDIVALTKGTIRQKTSDEPPDKPQMIAAAGAGLGLLAVFSLAFGAARLATPRRPDPFTWRRSGKRLFLINLAATFGVGLPPVWLGVPWQLVAPAIVAIVLGVGFSLLNQRLAAAATSELTAELDLSRWRLALNGAEPVRAATVDAFSTRMTAAGVAPSTMYPVYGMAEATLAITFPTPGTAPRIVHLDRRHLSEDGLAVEMPSDHPLAKPLVSVGRPVLGIRLRLVDTAGATRGPGRLGEIQISGPAVTTGYYGAPAATAETFDGPWLRTGDLGLQLDGDLFVTGRRKEMISVNGQNHFPEDAESLTRVLPGVHRGRCVAYADTVRERLTVAVEIAPGSDPDHVAGQVHRTICERLGTASVHVHPLPPAGCPAPPVASGSAAWSAAARPGPRTPGRQALRH
ncbi:Long-chain-fatty-acid--AMP ligase FadD26 [Streptomyces hundungensis]|uniref:Long-chain-fatty-acid--AMP ligase FadD26 n=1 Tax=Streptomyces hundungensis TaxID=1077946 RepID=A0A387H585_9ACTN|nr:AMP-binding protein [Streptomyces hundungensis]AYG78389.1 Long-chain-fatty-acid--AMP ligase FadD26 [Streptomyces hundungensis]